jgi:hypothetical protein
MNFIRASTSSAPAPPAPVAPAPEPPAAEAISPAGRLLLLSLLAVPLAAAPYFAIRSRLDALQRTLVHVRRMTSALHGDLRGALAESALRRGEMDRLRADVNVLRGEAGHLRAAVRRADLARREGTQAAVALQNRLDAEHRRARCVVSRVPAQRC